MGKCNCRYRGEVIVAEQSSLLLITYDGGRLSPFGDGNAGAHNFLCVSQYAYGASEASYACMARTPLPSDYVFKPLNLKAHLFAYLQEVAARLDRTPSDALNHELNFYRNWGLPPSLARRITAVARAQKQAPREVVANIVREAALKLPPAKPPKREVQDGPTHRTSMNVSGPNAASITAECMETGLSFNAVLMAQIEFSNTLGLHPELLAAIDKVADERGDTRRDVVHGIIRSAAEALPPVDEEPRARKR